MAPQVFDGTKSVPVDTQADAGSPFAPIEGGNGQIFISIASYRDGERCGATLKSIYENAKDPDRVFVGLSEQNLPEDQFCLEEYCKSFGVESLEKKRVREGVTKIVAKDADRKGCPHYDQVRLVAFHSINAKGPTYARTMVRKVLGNEEFCMQIDAHTDFIKDWDEIVLKEWRNTKNEYGVISNVPAPTSAKESHLEGGEDFSKVPRQCKLKFRDNGFPDFESPADGYVTDLDQPLLSHGWSAAFSFAKCHLEESAPYDPFLAYAMPIEQFSRYARFWTRGYDTYTPTQNIVFHDYGPQENGHGNNEWFKRQKDRFRKGSIERVKTALQIKGGNPSETVQANLGIYGIGKRRSIKQLEEFANLDFQTPKGNVGENLRCSGASWVPYDANISPVENMYDDADNLDPQPVFPLRTELSYYEQVEEVAPAGDVELDGANPEQQQQHHPDTFPHHAGADSKLEMPPAPLMFLLWVFGLMVWFVMFFGSSGSSGRAQRKRSHAKGA